MRGTSRRTSRARLLGALLHGVILGSLVSVAVTELVARADDARLFRYQTF